MHTYVTNPQTPEISLEIGTVEQIILLYIVHIIYIYLNYSLWSDVTVALNWCFRHLTRKHVLCYINILNCVTCLNEYIRSLPQTNTNTCETVKHKCTVHIAPYKSISYNISVQLCSTNDPKNEGPAKFKIFISLRPSKNFL